MKLRKLSPMKIKKLDNFFIKLDNDWFNLIDIYSNIEKDCINPITKKKLTIKEISKINQIYKNLISIETLDDDNYDNKSLLDDYIELFETQIKELNDKQEEMYAIIQEQQNEIELLKKPS